MMSPTFALLFHRRSLVSLLVFDFLFKNILRFFHHAALTSKQSFILWNVFIGFELLAMMTLSFPVLSKNDDWEMFSSHFCLMQNLLYIYIQ